MNVSVFSRMSPVQMEAPLALKAPPGLAELMVRSSLVTCTPLRNRLPSPLTTVPRGSAQRRRGGAQSAVRQQRHLAVVDGGGAVVGVGAGEEQTAPAGLGEAGRGEETGRAAADDRVDPQVGAGRTRS